MKDINVVRLSGTIFWSKLDDRQSFSMLRVGLKLNNGSSVFCTINNPTTKAYDEIKPGNKLIIANAWLDTWERENGDSEIQIRAYDSGTQFFGKDSALLDMNSVTVVGTVLDYQEENAVIEMTGERNPKTNQWAKRKTTVKIGNTYENINGKKILLEGKISSVDVEGKSKLVVEADYDKIKIL
jgi:hypothetical protein